MARTYTRSGGVSPKPYDSLNLGLFSGDERENVLKNMELLALDVGIEPSGIVVLDQVHGSKVLLIDGVQGLAGKADGLVSMGVGTGLMIQHADCGAVVFFDSRTGAIGAVHAGWRGVKEGVIGRTIQCMALEFGTNTKDLWVGLGPAVGVCCYEFRYWTDLLPGWMWRFVDENHHFDLGGAILCSLEKYGINRERIYVSKECTGCSRRLFSYRRNHPTGRLGTIIVKPHQS